MLVLEPSKPREFAEVESSGKRKSIELAHDDALSYAREAAKQFGVGESRTVEFDTERAKKDVRGEGETKTRGKKGRKAETKTEGV
jgi:CRISPR-associated protein Csb1